MACHGVKYHPSCCYTEMVCWRVESLQERTDKRKKVFNELILPYLQATYFAHESGIFSFNFYCSEYNYESGVLLYIEEERSLRF